MIKPGAVVRDNCTDSEWIAELGDTIFFAAIEYTDPMTALKELFLEDTDKGTNLIYSVEAQVGGKIAQVGSRLIDMTAKKMADIFFGKFSELISSEKNESSEIAESDDQKLPVSKINYRYLTAALVLGIFSIYWMFLK